MQSKWLGKQNFIWVRIATFCAPVGNTDVTGLRARTWGAMVYEKATFRGASMEQ